MKEFLFQASIAIIFFVAAILIGRTLMSQIEWDVDLTQPFTIN